MVRLRSGRKLLPVVALGTAVVAGTGYFALMNVPPARAQEAPTASVPAPAFEVVSIRRSRSGEGTSFHLLPNRLMVTNYPMDIFIRFAYGHDWGDYGFSPLRGNQIIRAPEWVRGGEFDYEGYDISAKVDDALVEKFGRDCGPAFFGGRCGYRQQYIMMIQSLLVDRFKLRVRRETKEGPVYALVVAKDGPKIAAAEPPDSTAAAAQSLASRPPCPAGMSCVDRAMTMGQMADWLSPMQLGRPVIDRTGLKRGYHIKLEWAREESLAEPEGANAKMEMPPPLGPTGPSIFTALQKQLGLKLEPTKGPVETVVIEHIERPSEN